MRVLALLRDTALRLAARPSPVFRLRFPAAHDAALPLAAPDLLEVQQCPPPNCPRCSPRSSTCAGKRSSVTVSVGRRLRRSPSRDMRKRGRRAEWRAARSSRASEPSAAAAARRAARACHLDAHCFAEMGGRGSSARRGAPQFPGPARSPSSLRSRRPRRHYGRGVPGFREPVHVFGGAVASSSMVEAYRQASRSMLRARRHLLPFSQVSRVFVLRARFERGLDDVGHFFYLLCVVRVGCSPALFSVLRTKRLTAPELSVNRTGSALASTELLVLASRQDGARLLAASGLQHDR